MEQQTTSTPIVIHPHTLQKFMRSGKDFANLLALYTFYIYHAQLQKTNQPLATDEFVRKGLNWAIDRVKRIKKILKDMKLIEVVQKGQYYYVHLFFIYTKKKIDEILGNREVESKEATKPKEQLKEKEEEVKESATTQKPKTKSLFEQHLIDNRIESKKITHIRKSILSIDGINDYKFNGIEFAKWMVYCEKNHIRYNTGNLKHWLDKINGRTTIEQKGAISNSITKKWKDIYLKPIEDSPYHKFLGKSIFIDNRLFENLEDIDFVDNLFVYRFKKITIRMKESPMDVFERFEYHKERTVCSDVKERIMGIIKRF